MPVTTLRGSKAAIEAVYEDLEPKITRLCRAVAARYRLDFEETVADANLHFLEAYHTFDRTKGDLTARVLYVVKERLRDRVRRLAVSARRMPCVSLDALKDDGHEPDAHATRDFDSAALEARLSDDARTVLRLIVWSPPEVLARIHKWFGRPAPRPNQVLKAVRQHLRVNGWDDRRWRKAAHALKKVCAPI